MFPRAISLLLLLSYSAFSQSSKIVGVVTDDTGKSPAGLYVIATLQSPTDHRTFTMPTGLKGDYAIGSLPAGTYSLCVHAPANSHLNNCHWSSPTQVTLSSSQALTKNISITQAAILQIRVDDPAKLVARNDDLLVAVHLPSGAFLPMPLATASLTGRTYEAAVPLHTPLRVSLVSTHLQMADDKGKSMNPRNLATAGTSIAIDLPGQSALHGPPTAFTVTGRK